MSKGCGKPQPFFVSYVASLKMFYHINIKLTHCKFVNNSYY